MDSETAHRESDCWLLEIDVVIGTLAKQSHAGFPTNPGNSFAEETRLRFRTDHMTRFHDPTVAMAPVGLLAVCAAHEHFPDIVKQTCAFSSCREIN